MQILSVITLVPAFIFGMKGAQLFFIIAIVVLLFGGAARLPKIMKSVGKAAFNFRQGLEEAKAEMNREVKKADQIIAEREEAEKKDDIEKNGGADKAE